MTLLAWDLQGSQKKSRLFPRTQYCFFNIGAGAHPDIHWLHTDTLMIIVLIDCKALQ